MITRRRVLAALAVVLAAGVVGVGVPAVRHAVFPWTVSQILETTVLTYPPWGFAVTEVTAGQRVEVEAGGGRRLAADFFPAARPRRGRLLFVPGSMPKGRRFGPYRFLARRFAEKGFDVLLPDIGGYGESRLEPHALPTFGPDVVAAARTLDRVSGDADPRRLVVLAHSLGASMALDAVVRRGLRPGRLVLWDPPLSGEIRHAAGPGRHGLRRFRGELQVEGGGTLAVDDPTLARYLAALDPLDLLRAMPEPRPKTLAALGDLVGDHTSLLNVIGIRSNWVTVLDLTGVDHFLSMVSLGAEGEWIVYRPETCGLFLDAVMKWLDRPAGGAE